MNGSVKNKKSPPFQESLLKIYRVDKLLHHSTHAAHAAHSRVTATSV